MAFTARRRQRSSWGHNALAGMGPVLPPATTCLVNPSGHTSMKPCDFSYFSCPQTYHQLASPSVFTFHLPLTCSADKHHFPPLPVLPLTQTQTRQACPGCFSSLRTVNLHPPLGGRYCHCPRPTGETRRHRADDSPGKLQSGGSGPGNRAPGCAVTGHEIVPRCVQSRTGVLGTESTESREREMKSASLGERGSGEVPRFSPRPGSPSFVPSRCVFFAHFCRASDCADTVPKKDSLALSKVTAAAGPGRGAALAPLPGVQLRSVCCCLGPTEEPGRDAGKKTNTGPRLADSACQAILLSLSGPEKEFHTSDAL